MQSDLTQNYKNLIIHTIYTHKCFISNLSQSLPEHDKFDGKNTIDSLEIQATPGIQLQKNVGTINWILYIFTYNSKKGAQDGTTIIVPLIPSSEWIVHR